MNDTRWESCTEPEEMLWYLHDLASDRLLRLFACASCRLIWPLVSTPDARKAVEMSEHFADGLTTSEELRVIEMAAQRSRPSGVWLAAWAAAETANADPWQAAQWAPVWAAEAAGRLTLAVSADRSPLEVGDHAWHRERQSQCAVLRDILGNPLKSLTMSPAGKQWNRGNVASLARSIYEHGRFADLPQLADALEQAGCTDSKVLNHCRSANHHVRGCWVLDELLGKRPEPRACTSSAWGRRRRDGLSYRLLVNERGVAQRSTPLLVA